jgi:hypothetical protein
MPKPIHILRILRRMWIVSTGSCTKSEELSLRHGKAARVADMTVVIGSVERYARKILWGGGFVG